MQKLTSLMWSQRCGVPLVSCYASRVQSVLGARRDGGSPLGCSPTLVIGNRRPDGLATSCPRPHGPWLASSPAAKTTTSKALLWPVALSDHCSVILFNYSCLKLKFWLLLWICYDHYNLSSIILCICFETWHTQPQIPGSATDRRRQQCIILGKKYNPK